MGQKIHPGGLRVGLSPLSTSYDEVDITTSPDLMEAYGEQIPVTFVDGHQHDFWRVDETRLREALA